MTGKGRAMTQPTIIIGFDMETDIGSWTSADQGVKADTPDILTVLRNRGAWRPAAQSENGPIFHGENLKMQEAVCQIH